VADKNQGGDKTERPTSKRLADARKKGDVAKSRDVTATATLLVWLLVLGLGAGFAGSRLAGLFDQSFTLISTRAPFASAAGALGHMPDAPAAEVHPPVVEHPPAVEPAPPTREGPP